ncbi:MAG: aldose 1-epimerase family protein [Eubacteriales bacterium]|nr:aldose 1-epimerase family protein [Eubacteriales bacterium]
MEYILRKGETTAIASSSGGELVSFSRGGTEYIWQGDPAVWPGRNPILFPVIGNLRNGTAQIQGKSCSMKRHGFARDMQWSLLELSEDSITMELRENETSLDMYPFAFSLRVTHLLHENGFSTCFHIENLSNTDMPFCIGGHTAFNCPLRKGESFEDYSLIFERPETARTVLFTSEGLISDSPGEYVLNGDDRLKLAYEYFRRLDTIAFTKLVSRRVSLINSRTGKGLCMDFHDFPIIAFWTKPGAPFLCLEPWMGCSDRETSSGKFEDKDNVLLLKPEKSTEFSFSISIIE